MSHRTCAAAFLFCLIAGCTSKSDPTAMMPASAAGAPTPDRGRYLAMSVTLCVFCHSEVDWSADGFPPKPGTVGAGRAPFNPDQLPWLTSPNISSDRETGAGTWSEAQFDSALRRGIAHDGRTLFPLMPYGQYHRMSDDDAASIVQFLKMIPPVKHEVPPTKIPEDLKPTISPLPPTGKVPAPERSETAEYGEYLSRIGLCGQCHTPKDPKGNPVQGMDFAGGARLRGPWGDVAALNITPDETGIEGVSEKVFMTAMRTGHLPGGTRLVAIMPWGYYKGMTDGDLRALYRFLTSLKPVRHLVDSTTAPTPCRKCGGTHGLGNKN